MARYKRPDKDKVEDFQHALAALCRKYKMVPVPRMSYPSEDIVFRFEPLGEGSDWNLWTLTGEWH